MLYIFAIGVIVIQFQHSEGVQNQTQNNAAQLEKILVRYWSWWINSPEDSPEANPNCSMGFDTENSFVYFLNPFEVGDVSYDCTEESVPKNYTLMFPLLTAFCSQGDAGLYGKLYEEIRDCTLNLDRGYVKGTVLLDGETIVNMSKDNGNGLEMKGVLENNLPQYKYYKEIFSREFVDLLATNNTTIPTNWEKPEEFEKSPTYYKAVVHCECIIIGTNHLPSGNHVLKYTVDASGGKSSIDLEDTGWKFTSSVTYRLNVK